MSALRTLTVRIAQLFKSPKSHSADGSEPLLPDPSTPKPPSTPPSPRGKTIYIISSSSASYKAELGFTRTSDDYLCLTQPSNLHMLLRAIRRKHKSRAQPATVLHCDWALPPRSIHATCTGISPACQDFFRGDERAVRKTEEGLRMILGLLEGAREGVVVVMTVCEDGSYRSVAAAEIWAQGVLDWVERGMSMRTSRVSVVVKHADHVRREGDPRGTKRGTVEASEVV